MVRIMLDLLEVKEPGGLFTGHPAVFSPVSAQLPESAPDADLEGRNREACLLDFAKNVEAVTRLNALVPQTYHVMDALATHL